MYDRNDPINQSIGIYFITFHLERL